MSNINTTYELDVDISAPDHRWVTATRCRERGEVLSRSFPDPIVRRCYRFNGYERRKMTIQEQYRVMMQYRDIAEAKKLFSDVTSERWMIEAAIVGAVAPQDIADYVGCDLATVQMYEKAFFDIRSRLNSRGFILNRILMPSFSRGLFGRDLDLLPKIISYCAGWETAKEFLDATRLSDQARTWLRVTWEDKVLKNAWKAAHCMQVNNFNAVEVQGVLMQLDALKSNAGSSVNKDEALQALSNLFAIAETTVRKGHESLEMDEPRVMNLLSGSVTEAYVSPTPAPETPVGVPDGTVG